MYLVAHRRQSSKNEFDNAEPNATGHASFGDLHTTQLEVDHAAYILCWISTTNQNLAHEDNQYTPKRKYVGR